MSDETVSFVRDEDCPKCGFPETYVEALGEPLRRVARGCRKCGWREEDDDGAT